MLYIGAVALGALHAFEPGHGKTLIASYMIGTKGRILDGILLGLIVTFTHTFSVLVLGIVAKVLAHSYSETELHNWLGLFSSILILGVGIWMLRQRVKGVGGHRHIRLFGKGDDHHNHDHHHHSHDVQSHQHSHDQESKIRSRPDRYDKWNLLLLGISGGMIPCPAAIATLLAAIGAGRTAEGLTVVVFFSLGLGLVMMSIGVILALAGDLTSKLSNNTEFSRRMGILSAVIITTLGTYTLFHSLQGIL